jgi:hypothetical protein
LSTRRRSAFPSRQREIGENYSAIGGFFLQYKMIYVVADATLPACEQTFVTTKTSISTGGRRHRRKHASGSRTTSLRWVNFIRTRDGTTLQQPTARRASAHSVTPRSNLLGLAHPAHGKGDELLFERGALAIGGLPFAGLKTRSLINVAAKAAEAAPDFSLRIRVGFPGFRITPPELAQARRVGWRRRNNGRRSSGQCHRRSR